MPKAQPCHGNASRDRIREQRFIEGGRAEIGAKMVDEPAPIKQQIMNGHEKHYRQHTGAECSAIQKRRREASRGIGLSVPSIG